MRISMIPSNDVKTIHASQNDTQRQWSFEPFDNSGTLIIGEESLANIKRIKGNTLAFNQLAPTLASGNYSANRSTITYSNNVATVTTNGNDGFGFYRSMATVVGHEYLFTAKVKPSKVGSLRLGLDEDSTVGNRIVFSSTAEKTVSRTWTCATANSPLICYYYNNAIASGDNYTITNLMVIDLTLMGLTSDQFESYFPLPYYSYQSTLLSFKGTSIKTVGKNLLPKMTPSVVNGITWTVNEDGTVVANGTASANSDSQLAVEFTLLEGYYYFNGCPDGGNDGSTWNCYMWDLTTGTRAKQWDKTSNVLNNTNSTQSRQFYSNGTNRYAYNCRVMRGQTVSNLVFKPMVRLSSADDVYEPYTSSTTNLPTLTYFPNGMKSAGNVYDELLPTKAITRVGMVDLGTLTWYQLGSRTDGYYTSGIPNGAKNIGVANVQSAHYLYSNEGATAMPNMTMKMDNNQNGYLYMVNSSIVSNPTAFKNSLSGEILYYELKTPTETGINTEVFYPVYQYGTEQILPINGANPVTSTFVGDIYYADGLKTDQAFLYRQTPINYNTRQFALVSKNTETPLTLKDGKGYCNSPLALTNESGFFDAKLKMTDSDGVCYSEKFQIHVERRP